MRDWGVWVKKFALEFSYIEKIKTEFWGSNFGEFGCDWSDGLRRDLESVLLMRCTSCV